VLRKDALEAIERSEPLDTIEPLDFKDPLDTTESKLGEGARQELVELFPAEDDRLPGGKVSSLSVKTTLRGDGGFLPVSRLPLLVAVDARFIVILNLSYTSQIQVSKVVYRVINILCSGQSLFLF
jgi:hypothetical protein